MNLDPRLIATSLLIISVITVVLAIPLILRLVKMNHFYGVRIPESFRSETRWYEINRFGGLVLVVWGLIVGMTGVAGLMLPLHPGESFALVAVGVVLGGILLATVVILVYAAKTKD